MAKLLIVDGNSIANRAFYALPFLTNREGKPSGALFGFANIIIKMITENQPTHIAIAFDRGRKTFRNDLYADYKGQRKQTPPELLEQFPYIKQMCEIMGFAIFEQANIEADDIIGTISKMENCEKIILSGDRDLLQLIDDKTVVWLTKRGVTDVERVGLDRLRLNYSLRPDQVIELKGLMGDTADNIPGVNKVGEKTAKHLLELYDNIDNVYKNIDNINGKLKDYLILDKDKAYLSRTLATIKRDCKIDFSLDDCKLNFPFSRKVIDFFKEWDFASLLKNPSLFDESVTIEVKKAPREELTEKLLTELIASKPKTFAYDLKNLTFAFDNKKVFYLSGNYDMFGGSLELCEVCKKFKPIFEDNNVLKLTMSSKDDIHYLEKLSIKLNNFYDLGIAGYIANAGLKTLEVKTDASNYFTLHDEYEKVMKDEGCANIYYDIELPLVQILADMETSGFKINLEKINELDRQYSAELEQLNKKIYELAGEEFNLNSPKQVAYILYDKLGIKTWNNKKRSTSVEVLDEIRNIPIIDCILKHRKVAKLKNTYIDVYKNICATSGNVIHTTFNQTLTSTGRLSSSEPNLQNIPTRNEEGRELRKIFESKFEGGGLFSADYNQIELRLLAHMSGEEKLISAYREGKDIHSTTASQVFGVKESEVTSDMRRDAKAVNFGIIYGMSDYGLSQNIKSTRKQAKEYIDGYFAKYPAVKKFMDDNVDKATEEGCIRTLYGRIRKIPELKANAFQTRSFGQRVAMNMPLQGTASDIIKIAMIRVYNAFKKSNMKSKLILQIHDELIVDTYPGEEEKVKSILKSEMEGVAKLKVPLITSIGYGKNLYDCK